MTDGRDATFVEQWTVVVEQAAEVFHWVDRLLLMLEDSPETTEFLAEKYGPVMWTIDHIREARYAMKE